MDKKSFISYLKFFPLTAFLLYARIFSFTPQAWQGAFILAGALAACVTTFLLFQPIILDRLMLGINLFFFVGASAFIFKIIPILQFYGAYKGPAFFMSIIAIGLITTFSSPAGFIGIYHHNKTALKLASYRLLAASFACLVLSFLLNSYGLLASATLPFITLRMLQEIVAKKLKNM